MLINRLFLIFATLALSTPLALFAAGVRGDAIENRAKTELPSVDLLAFVDSDFYAAVDDYANEQIPFREKLIRTDALIDRSVWNESPSPAVALGSDGWMFLRESWELGCRRAADPSATIDELIAVARVVEASGRDFALVVPPNKATMYPERLGSFRERARCLDENRNVTMAAIRRGLGADFIDMERILRIETTAAKDFYHPDDTHWTSEAAALMVEHLVEHFQPGLWEPKAVKAETVETEGDLTRLIGLPSSARRKRFTVQRPDVTATRLDDASRSPWEWVLDGSAEKLPQTTLIVHDSFFGPGVQPIVNYSQRTVFAQWRRANDLNREQPGWLALRVADAERLVMEFAERHVLGDFGLDDVLPTSSAELVIALEADLIAFRRETPSDDRPENGGPTFIVGEGPVLTQAGLDPDATIGNTSAVRLRPGVPVPTSVDLNSVRIYDVPD